MTMRRIAIILSLAVAAASGSAMAQAQALARQPQPQDEPALSRPPRGSIAGQLLLQARLKKAMSDGTTLAASLDHNRSQWDALSPDQRSRFRQEALAFLKESPQEQQRLLRHYEKLIALSADRQERYRQTAEWLRTVNASFTAAERQQLLEMPPDQRAKALLERKAELIRQGKLSAETAATAPTTRPATTATLP